VRPLLEVEVVMRMEVEMPSPTWKSADTTVAVINATTSDQALIYLVAGSLLGRNSRQFLYGTEEELDFYREILDILEAGARRMRELALERGLPIDEF
jgi:hypothetical protein